MATSYFPFDAGAGSAITESSWQKMGKRWLNTGVLEDYLNELAVTADGSGMTVSVNTGGAWIEGFYFESDAAAAQTITAAHATLGRIDYVVARLDRTANTIAFAVVAGTAAASPVAPTLSQTDTLYELGLATVTVDAAVGVIASNKVTDARTYAKNLSTSDASAAYLAKTRQAARVYATGAQSIPNETHTAVALAAEHFDTDALHDNAVNNTRLTIPAGLGGRWLIRGKVTWEAGTGRRFSSLRVDGATYHAQTQQIATAGGLFAVEAADVIAIAAGSYVELMAWQSTGGALSTSAATNYNTTLSAIYLGA